MVQYLKVALALLVLLFAGNARASDDNECDAELGEYNLALAICSVLILFFVSLGGALLPATLQLSAHPALVKGIKILSYTGSGVLLSTGFLHLLLPANEALQSPCLSAAWLAAYPSWAFLFCTLTIAGMQTIDYFIAKAHNFKKSEGTDLVNSAKIAASQQAPTAAVEDEPNSAGACSIHRNCDDTECGGQSLLPLDEKTIARVASLALAETSIAVHSVLIGLLLGVTSGDEFVPLLIALVFHQLLEGIALGTAAVEAASRTRHVLALALLYAMTTPLGTGIGIGVRHTMNPNSASGLMVQGILDAICAGMLIFLSLGDHVNAMKAQAGWLYNQSTSMTTVCMVAFFVGVGAMSTIAIWA